MRIGKECESDNRQDDILDELEKLTSAIQEEKELIEGLVRNQIEIKDGLIDKLHDELDYYKQDDADRFADQLVKAVIQIRQSMVRLMRSDKYAEMSTDDIRREYQYVFDDITDLLEQQNVDAYSSAPGTPFDGKIHSPKKEDTSDPQLDKTVKESVSEGYTRNGRTIVAERVIVYQCKN